MVDEFIKIIRILRKKCPWDREQTIETLLPKLIEESYEAMDATDREELKEELGDVLTVIFMMLVILEEEGTEMNSIFSNTIKKLITKHPHVFGDKKLETSSQVLNNWEKMREKEKGDFFKSIPKSLSSLQLAEIVQERAARVGFDWKDYKGVIEKIEEELSELKNAIKTSNSEEIEEEMGDLLFSIVNLARHLKVSPERTLRTAVNKFIQRFNQVYALAKKRNKLTLKEMDRIWNTIKERNKDRS